MAARVGGMVRRERAFGRVAQSLWVRPRPRDFVSPRNASRRVVMCGGVVVVSSE